MEFPKQYSNSTPFSGSQVRMPTSYSVDLYKEDGQWYITLNAPRWVLEDIDRTMREQIAPGVFIHASGPTLTCGMGENYPESMTFVTWGGGSIGAPPTGKKKIIKLKSFKKWVEKHLKKREGS